MGADRVNFDNSKTGRAWCRKHGPASRSGRDYTVGTSRTVRTVPSGSNAWVHSAIYGLLNSKRTR
nr:hypothetical protein CPGR_01818 [Mycolicibacterium komanii]